MRRALLVLVVMARAAAADDAAPIAVTPPTAIAGDGRAVATVVVTGGRPPLGKPLPVPEVAHVTCTGASALPATGADPAVLAPVVTTPTKLACVARVRDAEAPFAIEVRPPPPGLYAATTAVDARSTTRELALDALAWDGRARSAPAALQVAASEGTATVRDGRITLALSGNAPRLVALALADGERLGAAFVPVTGVTTIPVESEPGATVSVWIAGRWFGPAKTSGKLARVPIEVPPGVTHGVARSTGRAGYVTDAVTDLKIPDRPRIAALAVKRALRIGGSTTLAIAVAGADGRPAPPSTAVAGSGKGKLGPARSLGNGLWTMRYTAPRTPGPDRVTIRIDGDRRAGSATLDLDIRPGSVTRIELEVPAGPHEPGAALSATARVFDRAGNPVRDADVTATIGGASLEVTPGDPMIIRGRIPERLPEGASELPLVVSSEAVDQSVPVQVGAAAVSAEVAASVDGRAAEAELAIRDRFGNLVPRDRFEVTVTGGKLARIDRGRRAFRAAVIADPGAHSGRIVVRAGGRVLADERIDFEPPPHAIVFGAWASGGWIDNLGVLAGPRGGAGLAVRRGLFGAELALVLGFEATRFADTTQVTIEGAMRDAERSVSCLGGIAGIRARLRLSRRFGIAIGAAVIPTRASVRFAAGAGVEETYDEAVLGLRAQLHGDVKLGPGRFFVGGSYGRAKLAEGVVVGRIDGAAVVAGYEWWFADVGW